MGTDIEAIMQRMAEWLNQTDEDVQTTQYFPPGLNNEFGYVFADLVDGRSMIFKVAQFAGEQG